MYPVGTLIPTCPHPPQQAGGSWLWTPLAEHTDEVTSKQGHIPHNCSEAPGELITNKNVIQTLQKQF